MPLVEPSALREKILMIGGPGAGKTTDWLTIAWWAKMSGDTRKFYVLDTDDEAVLHVMNEPKYEGMLHSVNGEIYNEDGNVIIWSAYEWPEYQAFSNLTNWEKSHAFRAKKGDWVVLDFVTSAWAAAQEGFLHDSIQKTRGEVLYEEGVKGATGWEMYKTKFNWNAINGNYFDFIKPILIKSRAHIFMTSEMKVIQETSTNPDDKELMALYGKYSFVGQKKLGHQCRSYLRKQNLARGRVLFTNGSKDRARKNLDGETCDDFFKMYMQGVAGWSVTDPE